MKKLRHILVVLAMMLGLTAIATGPAHAGDASWAFRLPYPRHSGPALAILVICSPVLLGAWALRARQLRGRLEHPVLAAGLEVLTVAGIVGLFGVSLFGRYESIRAIDLDPLSGDLSSSAARRQVLGNFLMVTPVAAVAALRFVPLRRVGGAALTGGALMLALEASQYVMGGRVTSLQDWLLGTAGWTPTCVIAGVVIARTQLTDPSQ